MSFDAKERDPDTFIDKVPVPCSCEAPRVLRISKCLQRRVAHSDKARTVESVQCSCGSPHTMTFTECGFCGRIHIPLPGWSGEYTFKQSNVSAPL